MIIIINMIVMIEMIEPPREKEILYYIPHRSRYQILHPGGPWDPKGPMDRRQKERAGATLDTYPNQKGDLSVSKD